MSDDLIDKNLKDFLISAGFAAPKLSPLKMGRNSRVFRVESSGSLAVLKVYYRHPRDTRNRLSAEFDFLNFLSRQGILRVAQPIARDDVRGLGLYSCLPGKPITRVEPLHVKQAAKFVILINNYRKEDGASSLPLAAESCVSVQDHLDIVTQRVSRLKTTVINSGESSEFQNFVDHYLSPALQNISGQLEKTLSEAETSQELSTDELILSPSDFGFHNVLEHDGELFFVDFEYAGWDDGIKLLCDFSCQPELPVTNAQARQFCEIVERNLTIPLLMERVIMLTPLHRLKWCCILLNEYLPGGRDRRVHSGLRTPGLREAQLVKARKYFDQHLGS